MKIQVKFGVPYDGPASKGVDNWSSALYNGRPPKLSTSPLNEAGRAGVVSARRQIAKRLSP